MIDIESSEEVFKVHFYWPLTSNFNFNRKQLYRFHLPKCQTCSRDHTQIQRFIIVDALEYCIECIGKSMENLRAKLDEEKKGLIK